MSEKAFPFSAEQFLDVLAEAVTLIGEVAGRLPRNLKIGSPRARLYHAARVVMRGGRDGDFPEPQARAAPSVEARPSPHDATPRMIARTDDGSMFSVIMVPEIPLTGYLGGRAILTLAEATRLRDALNDVLEIEVLRAAATEAQAKLEARLAS